MNAKFLGIGSTDTTLNNINKLSTQFLIISVVKKVIESTKFYWQQIKKLHF